MRRILAVFLVALAVASASVTPASAGVLDEFLLASEIRDLRARVERGGPVDGERLQAAIAEGGEAGLALARAVLAYDRQAIREGRVPVLRKAGDRSHPKPAMAWSFTRSTRCGPSRSSRKR
jgi:hypothetical protein